MRALPPSQHSSHEGVATESIAPDADADRTAAAACEQKLLHHDFAGRVASAGNPAFAFATGEPDAHEADRFVLYHVMHDAPFDDIFQVEVHELRCTPTA